jgi:hypothetical protein
MTLADELAEVLARHNAVLRTNTPLEVLAEHMVASLQQFEASLIARADHKFFHPDRRNAP